MRPDAQHVHGSAVERVARGSVWSRLLAVAALAVVLLQAAPAAAHLMPSGHGTVNVIDDKAYLVVSIPVAAFASGSALSPLSESAAAAVADGALSAAEMAAHEAELREAVREGLRLKTDGERAEFSTILLNLPTGYDHDPENSSELMAMVVAHLAAPATSLTLKSQLWGSDTDSLTVETAITEDGRVVRSEVGVLTPNEPRYRFFASAGHVFGVSVQRGLGHLLGGTDHVVFLIVLLIAAVRPRRWLMSTLAFGAACTTAMVVASAGWWTPAPQIVELGIALSVVAVAVAAGLGLRLEPRAELPIVFAMGLLHGQGFMAVSGLEDHMTEAKVAGFSVGVWLGLLLLATVVSELVVALRHALGPVGAKAVRRVVAAAALVLGVCWTVDRVEWPAATDHTHTGADADHGHAHGEQRHGHHGADHAH